MSNLNEKLRIWNFDIDSEYEYTDSEGSKFKSYFLATLFIVYNKDTLEIKSFCYKIKNAKMQMVTKDRLSKDRIEIREFFLKTINKKNNQHLIDLEPDETNHYIKSKLENKKLKPLDIDFIYHFIHGRRTETSWREMSRRTLKVVEKNKEDFKYKYSRTYYWLFQLMGINSNLEYHICDNIMNNKDCSDYTKDEEGYFKRYEKLNFKEKLDIFLKQSKKDESFKLGEIEQSSNKRNKKYDWVLLILKEVENEVVDNEEYKKYKDEILELINKKDESKTEKIEKIVFRILDSLDKKIDFLNIKENNENKNHLKTRLIQMALISAQSEEISAQSEETKPWEYNFIYYGVPGTGKSYNSLKRALSIIKPDKYKMSDDKNTEEIDEEDVQDFLHNKQLKIITFHQNYGYEDFVEGIKAIPANSKSQNKINETYDSLFKKIDDLERQYSNNQQHTIDNQDKDWKSEIKQLLESIIELEKDKNKGLQFEKKDGVLKEMSLIAQQEENKDKKYVLIIDEINRGNASKIFGECFTLIETSKRLKYKDKKWTGSWKVTLPISGDDFGIPDNLYIIGTMNNSDYSITHFDVAFKRRFRFEEKIPNENLILNKYAKVFFKKLNKKLEEYDQKIGHSYFMGIEDGLDDQESYKKIEDIWSHEIKLLLNDFGLDNIKIDDIKNIDIENTNKINES